MLIKYIILLSWYQNIIYHLNKKDDDVYSVTGVAGATPAACVTEEINFYVALEFGNIMEEA